jgi:polysaccharide export outer membrane protein
MNKMRFVRTCIVIALAAVSAVSCVTNRKVAYLQDMKHNTQIELEDKFEAVICPYDELDVIITSFDSELARPFNLRSGNNTNYSMSSGVAYLVDVYGNIELPVLGTIHASGLTRLKLQDKIRELLVSGGYISDPFVLVRFRSFKIFFLGANGGKSINISNERCTFLEALAMSGDMSVFTDRDKIMVVREVDGKMVSRYLDPRSSKVYDDPFFMLQQNDFIITRNTGYRTFQQSYTQFGTVLSAISSIASLTATYFGIRAYMNNK